MKKLFLYNLFPPFIMDIIYSIIIKNVENPGYVADLSWWLILSQCFIVLPSYYIGTFMLFYFKYKKDIKDVLKAEFVSVVILPVMLMATSGIISKVSYSLQDLVVFEMFCILSFSIAFLFGAIIIAVISYIKKRKAGKTK